MSALTGLLYAALLFYGVGWYLGQWSGNFSLLLFVLTLVTLAYWLAERLFFLPRRRRHAQAAVAQWEIDQRARGGDLGEAARATVMRSHLEQPWWLDWTAGLFPVILAVFLLRSFLFEPFKIPSGSMIPTLQIGDLILVNKFHYGLRLPIINKKIVANHEPQRGDVIVFRYPVDTSVDYIKRVVGLPGDEVSYLNKKLSINGQPVPTTVLPDYYDAETVDYAEQASEKLGDIEHRLLTNKNRPGFVIPMPQFQQFRDACRYNADGVVCTVPVGHYFMMGDNRDNSQDSRYWGFVPDENIVGKAFFVWMNFGNLGRIGSFK